MPAKSAKQFKFMAMAAHNPSKMRSIGPSKAIAEEFVKKTPKAKRSEFMRKK